MPVRRLPDAYDHPAVDVFSPHERGVVEKTSTVLVRLIRAAIIDGRLEPSKPLREVDLAQQLGTSRTPIREALLVLESEGLVEAVPNRGAIVRSYTPEDLRELYTLRAVLEGFGARCAATRITDPELTLLAESCERYGKLRTHDERLPELAQENFTFHRTILDAAGSARLTAMVQQSTALPLIYQSYMEYSEDNRRTALEHHLEILELLKQRDADRAGERMEGHVLWARDVAVAHLVDSE
jgi:DNA-binding GntR family transcriptional regulator